MTAKLIALSIDDGPDESTGELLALLENLHIRATFFLTGDHVRAFPAQARAIVDAGHEIGNHSDTHERLSDMDAAAVMEDLAQAEASISRVCGEKPVSIRVPYMSYSDAVERAAHNLNMPLIDCAVIAYDWEECVGADDIVENIVLSAADGGIILIHEPYAKTRAALPVFVKRLRDEGYEIICVGDLAARRNIHLEPGIRYNGLTQ